MSRKRKIFKKKVFVDGLYKSKLIFSLINKIMYDGKKNLAISIVYGAFDIIKFKKKCNPMKIFEKAINNIIPELDLKTRRVGGSILHIPVLINEKRKINLVFNWLIDSSRKRKEKTMKERLAFEIIDSANGNSNSIKKKENLHRMAEANKAFAHYRW